jgi:hypothetical protein
MNAIDPGWNLANVKANLEIYKQDNDDARFVEATGYDPSYAGFGTWNDLFIACVFDDIPTAREYFRVSGPKLSVRDAWARFPALIAIEYGSCAMFKLLLHPKFNLDINDIDAMNGVGTGPNWNLIWLAIAEFHESEQKEFLLSAIKTSTSHAIANVEILFARTGIDQELDCNLRSSENWLRYKGTTAAELLMRCPIDSEIGLAFEGWKTKPLEMQARLRMKHGFLLEYEAARLIAYIVLLSDGYFVLSDALVNDNNRRYMSICARLPFELQMILALRTYSQTTNSVSSKLFNWALTKIIW